MRESSSEIPQLPLSSRYHGIPKLSWPVWLVVAAALLRLVTLADKSIWLDEAYAVYAAAQGHQVIWSGFDPHPPLYFSFLHEWLKLVPMGSEFWLRLPSALASIAGLVLIYQVGKRLFDARFGLIALALLAFSPLEIWYAQEARMYPFVVLAGLLVMFALVWPHKLAWPLYLVGVVFGLYMDHTMIPVWLMIMAVWLVYWWGRGRNLTQLLLCLTASGLAWLLFRPWWALLGNSFQRTVVMYEEFVRSRFSQLPEISTDTLVLLLVVGWLGLVAAAFLGYAALRSPALTSIIAPLTLFPFLLIVLLTPIPRLYIPKRLLVTGWPLVILGVTWLVWQLQEDGRRMAWLMVGVSLVASLVSLFLVPKPDWRGAAAFLDTFAAPTDWVWVAPPYNGIPYDYYATQFPNSSGGERRLRDAAAATQTIWYITDAPASPIAPTPDQLWLDNNWQLVQEIPDFFRLTIRRYRVP